MPMEKAYDHTQHPWSNAAAKWLHEALDNVVTGTDPFIAIDAARACLEIEAGIREPDQALIDDAPVVLP